jgi:Fe-S-cluster containining protein
MTSVAVELPEPLRGRRQLAAGERFRFRCHPDLPCFNCCCSDVTILLTPVDVLRLARRLGMHTREFLRRNTLTPITKQLQLPVVMLRMGSDPEKRCPFVSERGCTVYADRPWACRMYPVGMGLPPARAGVEPAPAHFLFEDEFCHGRESTVDWTVDEWRHDQGVGAQEAIEAAYQDIVSHPWFIGGRQLDPKRIEMFYTACYDLDTFREFVLTSSFLRRFEIEASLVERLRDDNDALLRFALERWLRFALFAEPTMKVRDGAGPSRRSP